MNLFGDLRPVCGDEVVHAALTVVKQCDRPPGMTVLKKCGRRPSILGIDLSLQGVIVGITILGVSYRC